MLFGQVIKGHRKKLGYTQVQLSVLSGVSLPTLQNIEANKANPSFSTMEALSKALGMTYQVAVLPANWDFLISAGVPLGRPTPLKDFDRRAFVNEIKQACLELSAKAVPEMTRHEEALAAFLFGIRKHFPTFYTEHFAKVPVVRDFFSFPQEEDRLLKLSRQAISILARYL